ncbi:CHASE3 domain-containing protein, partial [Lutibaculum baratangense]|uniref:CHASE3 domain-containing protein n=1 Tax=Lutibaculum baratangense TaxID=1358440 RepID=UPI00190F7C37
MRNLSTTSKLAIAFAVIVLTFAGASALVFRDLGVIRAAADANETSMDLTLQAEEMLTYMVEQDNAVRGFMIRGEEEFAQAYAAAVQSFAGVVDSFLAATSLPAQRERVTALAAAAAEWQTQQAEPQMRLFRDAATRGEARLMMGRMTLAKVREIHAEVLQAQRRLMEARREAQFDAIASSSRALALGGLAALLVAGVMLFLLTRLIGRPIV